jgi:hypothetical protein
MKKFIFTLVCATASAAMGSMPALACEGQFKPLFQVKINKTEHETHTMGIISNGERPTHLYYSNPHAKKADKKCLKFALNSLSTNQAMMEELGHVGAMIRIDKTETGQKLVLQYTEFPQWKFMTTAGERKNDEDFENIQLGFQCPTTSTCKVTFQGKPLSSLEVEVKTQRTQNKNRTKDCEEKVIGIHHIRPTI